MANDLHLKKCPVEDKFDSSRRIQPEQAMAEILDGLAGCGEVTGYFYTPSGLGGRFWPFSWLFMGFIAYPGNSAVWQNNSANW